MTLQEVERVITLIPTFLNYNSALTLVIPTFHYSYTLT